MESIREKGVGPRLDLLRPVDEIMARDFDQLLKASLDLPAPTPWPKGPLRIEQGGGVVLSAPHQAVHMREGIALPSEYGSAELVFALARTVNGSAICTAEAQAGDPNWDIGHPYCDKVYELANGAPVLDFHKMRRRGVEICVGLGPHPDAAERLWQPIVTQAVAAGLRVSVNWPFAAGAQTVTGQLQERGLAAVQLELSFDCYDPGPVRVAAWSALLRALRIILASPSPRP